MTIIFFILLLGRSSKARVRVPGPRMNAIRTESGRWCQWKDAYQGTLPGWSDLLFPLEHKNLPLSWQPQGSWWNFVLWPQKWRGMFCSKVPLGESGESREFQLERLNFPLCHFSFEEDLLPIGFPSVLHPQWDCLLRMAVVKMTWWMYRRRDENMRSVAALVPLKTVLLECMHILQ